MQMFEQIEVFDVQFEFTTENSVEITCMQAPRFILEQRFTALVRQVAYLAKPVKIKMKRMIPVYSKFDDCWYNRECSIEFMNQAYERQYGMAT